MRIPPGTSTRTSYALSASSLFHGARSDPSLRKYLSDLHDSEKRSSFGAPTTVTTGTTGTVVPETSQFVDPAVRRLFRWEMTLPAQPFHFFKIHVLTTDPSRIQAPPAYRAAPSATVDQVLSASFDHLTLFCVLSDAFWTRRNGVPRCAGRLDVCFVSKDEMSTMTTVRVRMFMTALVVTVRADGGGGRCVVLVSARTVPVPVGLGCLASRDSVLVPLFLFAIAFADQMLCFFFCMYHICA
jgi:hypothetical protein